MFLIFWQTHSGELWKNMALRLEHIVQNEGDILSSFNATLLYYLTFTKHIKCFYVFYSVHIGGFLNYFSFNKCHAHHIKPIKGQRISWAGGREIPNLMETFAFFTLFSDFKSHTRHHLMFTIIEFCVCNFIQNYTYGNRT